MLRCLKDLERYIAPARFGPHERTARNLVHHHALDPRARDSKSWVGTESPDLRLVANANRRIFSRRKSNDAVRCVRNLNHASCGSHLFPSPRDRAIRLGIACAFPQVGQGSGAELVSDSYPTIERCSLSTERGLLVCLRRHRAHFLARPSHQGPLSTARWPASWSLSAGRGGNGVPPPCPMSSATRM
jgi:hypothetical protein